VKADWTTLRPTELPGASYLARERSNELVLELSCPMPHLPLYEDSLVVLRWDKPWTGGCRLWVPVLPEICILCPSDGRNGTESFETNAFGIGFAVENSELFIAAISSLPGFYLPKVCSVKTECQKSMECLEPSPTGKTHLDRTGSPFWPGSGKNGRGSP
jgi:hypothetical protein